MGKDTRFGDTTRWNKAFDEGAAYGREDERLKFKHHVPRCFVLVGFAFGLIVTYVTKTFL
ncbi:MAG: hypothetical protein M0P71_00675 [Melioribacteraceae bacterium]|nr:hypothetical protein [Melioribacteraceae bacterium]